MYDDRVLDHLFAAGPGNSVAGGGLCAAWADTGLVAGLARALPDEGGVPETCPVEGDLGNRHE